MVTDIEDGMCLGLSICDTSLSKGIGAVTADSNFAVAHFPILCC